MEMAIKLDYKHNWHSEIARMDKHVIGIVASSPISNLFYFPIWRSIFEMADMLGYGIEFYRTDGTNGIRSNTDIIRTLEEHADGILYVGNFFFSKEELKILGELKCPIVSVFGNIDIPNVIHVKTNNHKAAYEATNYLIKLGHTKIAHIMAQRSFDQANERKEGYVKALEDNNLPVNENLIAVGDLYYSQAYKCSLDLIDSGNEFSAVFCFNDECAAAFIRAAKDRNWKVPDDISIVGFDDVLCDNDISKDIPLITTMRQPRRDMATYAFNSLLNRIRGIDVPIEKVFNPILIERFSTAPFRVI